MYIDARFDIGRRVAEQLALASSDTHAVDRSGVVTSCAALVSCGNLDSGVTSAAQMTGQHALHIRQHRIVRTVRHAYVCGGQELQRVDTVRGELASDKQVERHSERCTVERSGGTKD